MNEQPEALRLANALETADAYSSPMDGALRVKITPSTLDEAAAELRRLHNLCTEWEKKAATWLATPEAAKRLDGYRELFQRVDTLEYALWQAVEALERGETQLRYQAIAAAQQALREQA